MRLTRRLVVVMALCAFSATPAAMGSHNLDLHEDMTLVGRFDDDGTYQAGTDLAFWGDRAVLGNQDPGGFRLLDISDATNPRELGQFDCGGGEADVSIWKNLVIVSVDDPLVSPDCPAQSAALQDQTPIGTAWEGIRIVSIKDPARPVQIAAVDTPCGSHTHTLIPDTRHRDASGNPAPRLIVYVNSSPETRAFSASDCVGTSAGALGSRVSVGTHRRVVVVEVPLNDPASARVVAQPDVSPADGCHDVSVLLDQRTDSPRLLAGAACFSESQVWDISDPANPKVLAHITNPQISSHHSAAFNWEGDTLILGDEQRLVPGCLEDDAASGALWFYDVSDPSHPQERGHFVIPQQRVQRLCTAHNYNVVPLADGRDVLVASWTGAGTTVVDFTDPANPQQIAFYIPVEDGLGSPWSSYWYNGFVYANDEESRGLDVFSVDDPALSSALTLPRLNPQTQERPAGVGD